MAEGKKRSVWVYVGIGCGILLFVIIAAAGTIGYFGYRAFKQIEREMKDPVARAAKAQKVLGCEAFPDGYHAAFTLSIPILLDMAILSDLDTGPDGDSLFDERGFLYLRTLRTRDFEEMEAYFDGERSRPRLPDESGIDFDLSSPIARGSFARDDMTVEYVAHRGWLRVDRDGPGGRRGPRGSGTGGHDGGGGDGGEHEMAGEHAAGTHDTGDEAPHPERAARGHRDGRVEGILSFINLECSSDEKVRLGVWLGPDPEAPEGGEADLTGTPADENALRGFLAPLAPCRY